MYLNDRVPHLAVNTVKTCLIIPNKQGNGRMKLETHWSDLEHITKQRRNSAQWCVYKKDQKTNMTHENACFYIPVTGYDHSCNDADL